MSKAPNITPPESRSLIAKFFRRETKICGVTHTKNLKNSFKVIFIIDVVTELQTKRAGALRQSPDITVIDNRNEEVVLTRSNDKKHVVNNFI